MARRGAAMPLFGSVLALVLAFIGLRSPAAEAALTWGPPVAVSAPAQDAAAPQVAVDPGGDAVALWYRFAGNTSRIEAATMPAGGAWGGVQSVAAGGDVFGPQVAVDGVGNATGVWYDAGASPDTVSSAVGPVGGAWTGGQALGNGDEPQIAEDAAGDTVAVWYVFNGTINEIEAAVRPAGGSWSAPQAISDPGADSYGPRVAIDATGNATAVWYEVAGGVGTVHTASRPAGGSWSAAPEQSLSVPGQDAAAPQVVVDSSGDAVAVWYAYDGSFDVVQAATRSAGGAWSAPQQLSLDGGDAQGPQVALDGQGNATVVWYRFDGSEDVIQAARHSASGWSGPLAISVPGQSADEPQVAADTGGDAVAVWYRFNGNEDVIEGAAQPAGGNWGTPQQLSSPGEASAPQVGLSSSGTPVAVWTLSSGGTELIQATGSPSAQSGSGAGGGTSGSGAGGGTSGAGGSGTTGTAGGGGSNSTAGGRSGHAPQISSLRIRPARFRAARSGATVIANGGALVSYRDSERAVTTFFIRRLPARTPCPRRRPHRTTGCVVRGQLVGRFVRRDRAGVNRFRFSGRMHGRALVPGNYRLVASPRDSAGRTGSAREVRFSIR